MHRDATDAPYHISINAVPKYNPSAPAEVIGYSVRVTVARTDRKPVQGTFLNEHSDDMVPLHGDRFLTIGEALDHGEAWGRHCIAQWREAGAH
ncbi:hypothetical protein [Paraburkholderia sp. BL21I4N1]|uniref:hypothetical protein n=1 Tax=Paraburkholderia sp. BL21I4N1 TaxID=1938801 RepID=UPI000D4EDD83|nr:hypothetical protein [Paraburkholderia sp. BL21I4N1]PQV51019.1 hypothetical protein B0G83_105382 [Paraburkholderia sp. BL21I4N1]